MDSTRVFGQPRASISSIGKHSVLPTKTFESFPYSSPDSKRSFVRQKAENACRRLSLGLAKPRLVLFQANGLHRTTWSSNARLAEVRQTDAGLKSPSRKCSGSARGNFPRNAIHVSNIGGCPSAPP